MAAIMAWALAHWYLAGFLYAILNEVFVAFPSTSSNSILHGLFVALGWAQANAPAGAVTGTVAQVVTK